MDLPVFIETEIDRIMTEWTAFAHSLRLGQASLTDEEARDSAQALLLAIAKDMRTAQSADEQSDKAKGYREVRPSCVTEFAYAHAQARLDHGFSQKDLAAEMRALRANVIRQWQRHAGPHDIDSLIRFNEGIDQAWSETLLYYSDAVGRMRNMFVGVLAHDLRSPLGTISMSGQFLTRGATLSLHANDAVERICRAANRMQRMVDDLLDFTRARLGESLPMTLAVNDLSAICRHAVEEVQISYPHVTITEAVEGDPIGRWDGGRLSQLVSNLLVNAAQHGDGTVTIAMNCLPDVMRISVVNTGKEIAAETLHTMFDPLIRSQTTTAKKGTAAGLGLGLYIVREILKAHQGNITVTSSHGITTFTAEIPRISQ